MTVTVNDLSQILANHKAWLNNNAEGKRADLCEANLRGANLRGASGVFALGNPDHWFSFAYVTKENVMRLRIGCRDKTLVEGREYWKGKDDRREVLAALDYAEAIAKLRGWKTEEGEVS